MFALQSQSIKSTFSRSIIRSFQSATVVQAARAKATQNPTPSEAAVKADYSSATPAQLVKETVSELVHGENDASRASKIARPNEQGQRDATETREQVEGTKAARGVGGWYDQ